MTLLQSLFAFSDAFLSNQSVTCPSHRYMGIGLSAQGVNMNRLPGKTTVRAYVRVHSSLFVRLPRAALN